MSEIILAGDWHGDLEWALFAIREAAGQSKALDIFHLGDFGIWPGKRGEDFVAGVSDLLTELSMKMFVTPGNHEDYSQIMDPASHPEDRTETYLPSWMQAFAPKIYLLRRGCRMIRGGRSIISLGGAPSVDFHMRVGGVSWWPEEFIRVSDLDRMIPSDIMLAHDSPDCGTQAVQDIINTPPHLLMWREDALRYAASGREIMNEAVSLVNPRVFAHGHYHVADERFDKEQNRRYVSLNMNRDQGNLATLNLENLRVTWMNY